MKSVGVPREIKEDEQRVALSPQGARELAHAGVRVLVERGAGEGSGFPDEAYRRAGAETVAAAQAWGAELVLKVKEPQPEEYPFLRRDQVLFTYLHLAADRELTETLCRAGTTAIAYETVQTADGALPLLLPMSEVAGRMATQVGARFLEQPAGGRGVLLGGVPGVPPAQVSILGGGVVGTNAARVALGMGAQVTLLDRSPARLRQLDDLFGGRAVTIMSTEAHVAEAARRADLFIAAVLVPGARAPRLVTREMVEGMKAGAVIVDVAVDQGGAVETADRPTTHSRPTYVRHGVVHYAVANIPGAVPRTSTYALTNATLPYVQALAARGWREACEADPALGRGVNVAGGEVAYPAVAEAHGLPAAPWRRAVF